MFEDKIQDIQESYQPLITHIEHDSEDNEESKTEDEFVSFIEEKSMYIENDNI